MTKPIRVTPSTMKPIEIKASTQPRVDTQTVVSALGADPGSVRRGPAKSPISKFALREELGNRLHSSGGRPALSGVERRAKIPLSDRDWLELEELANSLAHAGFTPTAGQVASALLSLSLRTLASSPSALADFAEHAKSISSKG